MRSIAAVFVVAALTVAVAVAQQKTSPAPPKAATPAQPATPKAGSPAQPASKGAVAAPAALPAATPSAADEQAIRQIVDAVTKAYNAHDAKALSALFIVDGELIDENGTVSKGRAAIEELFGAVFQEFPKAKMEIAIESIRSLGPVVVVEEGLTEIVHEPDDAPEISRYSVIYVKQDGRWQMASARDIADAELRAINELEQLGWLVGDWVDESADAVVMTSYRWTDNHKFILGEFLLQIGGQPAMSGSQRIGWDPLAKQIRSWVFDSEGGFGEGLWTQDENRWIVKYSGVTRDGSVGSATNNFIRLDPNTFAFESHDRMEGGERTEDTPAIVVVRMAPAPEED